MDFVGNLIANSVSGFVEAGTRSLGEYAGDAIIKAGDIIENTGRNVGAKVENTAAYYGAKISGQDPRKTNSYTQKSLPAPQSQKLITYPYSGGAKTASNKSVTGAYKKPAPSAVKAATQQSKAVVPYGAKTSTTTSVTQKKPLPKPYPNTVAYPSTKAKTAAKALPKPFPNNTTHPGAKANSNKTALPKPFPNNTTHPGVKANSNTKSLPKPFPQNTTPQTAYPTSKKTAVTRNNPKPFVAPEHNTSTQKSTQYGSMQPSKGYSNNTQKAYPGQGEMSRTPVKKYKAAERYKPPFEKGAAVHIPEIKV